MFGLGVWVRLGVGVAIVAALVWTHATAYRAGADAERQATLERSVDILRQRNQTNEEIDELDAGELCLALGGRVSDDGSCV